MVSNIKSQLNPHKVDIGVTLGLTGELTSFFLQCKNFKLLWLKFKHASMHMNW